MIRFLFSGMLLIFNFLAFSQIEGNWKIIDESGNARSVVEIYQKNDGKYYGKIVMSLEEGALLTCEKCKGALKGQPIIGMDIITGLEKKGDKFVGGEIFDPEKGKTYKCKIKLNDDGSLDVRGFIGITLLGRTQTWIRE